MAKTCVVDFTLTPEGLESQLLERVIRREKNDLEVQRLSLHENVLQYKQKQYELQNTLLKKLSSTEGNLLDDLSLLEVLNTTRVLATDIAEKLESSSRTEASINKAREHYRPVARRGSTLYFVMTDLRYVRYVFSYAV